MRIYGPNGTSLGSPASSARRTSSTGFALPDATSTTETRAAIAPKATANIDALLAMQGIEEDPTERRKRSVQRGKGALDVLDDLKIGLLSGNFDTSTVTRLRAAAANLKSSSGDPGLDAVLSEIELRVEVELANAGPFWTADCLGKTKPLTTGLLTGSFAETTGQHAAFGGPGRYCL